MSFFSSALTRRVFGALFELLVGPPEPDVGLQYSAGAPGASESVSCKRLLDA